MATATARLYLLAHLHRRYRRRRYRHVRFTLLKVRLILFYTEAWSLSLGVGQCIQNTEYGIF
jgi:hypothetical protein